ncbi:MAG TPA: co-chaperone GroES [Erysipelotrichaceae bacterium]|nr:co-chaperone GroES [Erysipelotrichaceae bacterium]HQB32525.1 co-chaperone GroES [Erysipelotrichaceae bacterium]
MIKPLNENVLLKRAVVESKTASGIILTANSREADNIGIVVAVYESRIVDGNTVTPMVKVNDKVVFDNYAAMEVEYLNEKYLLVPETSILAIIE